MAIYQFQCQSCGYIYDRQVEMDMIGAYPPGWCERTRCMERGKGLLRRVFNVPTLTFKGTGWAGKPAIMSDPIAEGSPMQGANWGHQDPSMFPLESEIDSMGKPAPAPINTDASDLVAE